MYQPKQSPVSTPKQPQKRDYKEGMSLAERIEKQLKINAELRDQYKAKSSRVEVLKEILVKKTERLYEAHNRYNEMVTRLKEMRKIAISKFSRNPTDPQAKIYFDFINKQLIHCDNVTSFYLDQVKESIGQIEAGKEKLEDLRLKSTWLGELKEEQEEVRKLKEKVDAYKQKLQEVTEKYKNTVERMKSCQHLELNAWIVQLCKNVVFDANLEKKIIKLKVVNAKLEQECKQHKDLLDTSFIPSESIEQVNVKQLSKRQEQSTNHVLAKNTPMFNRYEGVPTIRGDRAGVKFVQQEEAAGDAQIDVELAEQNFSFNASYTSDDAIVQGNMTSTPIHDPPEQHSPSYETPVPGFSNPGQSVEQANDAFARNDFTLEGMPFSNSFGMNGNADSNGPIFDFFKEKAEEIKKRDSTVGSVFNYFGMDKSPASQSDGTFSEMFNVFGRDGSNPTAGSMGDNTGGNGFNFLDNDGEDKDDGSIIGSMFDFNKKEYEQSKSNGVFPFEFNFEEKNGEDENPFLK